MEQHCIHEQDWGEVKSKVEKVYNDVEGNGKKGLRDTVTELNVNTQNLAETVQGLTTSVNALIKFQTETTAEKLEQRRKTLLGVTLIMVSFTILNIVLGWVVDIRDSNARPTTYQDAGTRPPARF
jgi:hypothetical protein